MTASIYTYPQSSFTVTWPFSTM